MRLFIGIKIDQKAQKKINGYFNFFYENKVSGNYMKLSNLHMTLVFLGETDERKVSTIKDIISNINLKIDSIKIAKTAMLKDILVGEVVKGPELEEIYQTLKKELKKIGFTFEDGKLYPHVTLIRKVNNQEKFVDKEMNIVSYFDHITLFESKRINNELIYVDLGK